MATKPKPLSQYPMSFKDAFAALLRLNLQAGKRYPKPNRSLKQAGAPS
jgi:hypothetical protein